MTPVPPAPVAVASPDAGVDAGRTGAVGVEPVAGARWTLTAGPLVRVTG
ncbi:hypothetical protein [Streptomyces sp. NPDC127119]